MRRSDRSDRQVMRPERFNVRLQDQRQDQRQEQQPERQNEEPLLVRPEEAARLLSVGRTMIYELMKRGELPVVHIGRATRIATRDLHAWVDQHRSSVAL